jgi:hypothetical protein
MICTAAQDVDLDKHTSSDGWASLVAASGRDPLRLQATVKS